MYRITLCCLSVILMTSSVDAVHRGSRGCVTCPSCQTCCELNVKEVIESKHGWDVECEDVCVPRIVFPWQKHHLRCCKTGKCAGARACTGECCGRGCGGNAGGICKPIHNGARVVSVRKLRKLSFECPACKYEWTPKDKARNGCDGSCQCSAAELSTKRRTLERTTAAAGVIRSARPVRLKQFSHNRSRAKTHRSAGSSFPSMAGRRLSAQVKRAGFRVLGTHSHRP